MIANLLPIVLPDAVGGFEDRRYLKRIHDENLERLEDGELVYLPEAEEAEESIGGRVEEYHELTKDEIRRHGEEAGTDDGGARLYRIPPSKRQDVRDLTERTSKKLKRKNRKAYIAAFTIGVLVFGPLVTFISVVL